MEEIKTMEYKKMTIRDCVWNHAVIECIRAVNALANTGNHSYLDPSILKEPERKAITDALKFKLIK